MNDFCLLLIRLGISIFVVTLIAISLSFLYNKIKSNLYEVPVIKLNEIITPTIKEQEWKNILEQIRSYDYNTKVKILTTPLKKLKDLPKEKSECMVNDLIDLCVKSKITVPKWMTTL